MASELIDWDVRESLRKKLDYHEREARRLRSALAGYDAELDIVLLPGDARQPMMRWLRKNGKPMRPIEVMGVLLREHGGELPTMELYALMEAGGAFQGKGNPESAFKLSIKTNVRLGKIVQLDPAGNQIENISPTSPILGITRLKT
jgi:hypothetical protein